MNFTARRERLRAILAGDRCVHTGSVYDPISARIAEDIGFEVALLGGSVASLAILGSPDLGLITLTELAEQCRRICRATELPLLVDADHGYGNAMSAMRTVEELEAAGIAALTIEDVVLPRPYGPSNKVPPISAEEMVGKLRAAVRGRLDPSLVVVGRLTGLRTLGLEDTLKRIELYQATGVDAIMPTGVSTREEVGALGSVSKLPLVFGAAPGADLGTAAELAKKGVRLALQGHVPPLAAAHAIHAALKAQHDGVKASQIPNLASGELMGRIMRRVDYDRWTAEFLGGK